MGIDNNTYVTYRQSRWSKWAGGTRCAGRTLQREAYVVSKQNFLLCRSASDASFFNRMHLISFMPLGTLDPREASVSLLAGFSWGAN